MDIQLILVIAIVVAAVVYMFRRAHKARSGRCSCGCEGCGKGCSIKKL